MAAGSPTLTPFRNEVFCALAVPRALKVPCRPPEVPPTSGRLITSPGTLASTSAQMSRPPGVPWISCSLRLTRDVRARRVDGRRCAGHGDVLREARQLHREVHRRRLPDQHDDVLARDRLEAGELELDAVGARHERREAVDAAGIRDAGHRSGNEHRAADGDADAGHDAALIVHGLHQDAARLNLRARGCRGEKCRQHDEATEDPFHALSSLDSRVASRSSIHMMKTMAPLSFAGLYQSALGCRVAVFARILDRVVAVRKVGFECVCCGATPWTARVADILLSL